MSQPVQAGEDEKIELQTLLASGTFARCPNLAKLLRFMCNKYWDGKAEDLKEYILAVEALGRPPDFDPTINPTTRVEVHRLREKLKKYYETDGFKHRVMIMLQPGNYIPQFVRREENAAAQVGSIRPGPAGELGISHVPETPSAVREKVVPPPPKDSSHPDIFPAHGIKNLSMWAAAVAIAALALGLLAVLVAPILQHVRSSRGSSSANELNATPTSTTAPGEGSVRIICGYLKNKYIDSGGNVWSGDRFFAGGNTDTSPQRLIFRTRDPTLFDYGRSGDFTYDIPLKPGPYELRLYFEETHFGPGTIAGGGENTRVFGIELNGRPVLQNFDPYMDAEGNFLADIRAFKGVTPASDGYLHLKFEKGFSEPFLNAIEVFPANHGKLNPIHMVAQDNSFVDGSGNVWEPDHYVIGGRLTLRQNPAEGTADPNLYAGERWGAFNYAIPVAEGRYALTLYFAEAWFGALGPGGVGSRLFNVYCNGVALLRNFDIFKEAGGANRAFHKTFHGLRPDARGKLMLTFDPVKNYACINALEVVDESD